MSKNNLRIVIPKTVDGIIKLANLIYNKHLQDGKNSPLNTLSDYNWNEHGPTLQQTIEKHAEAEDLNRRAEQTYRERDLAYTADLFYFPNQDITMTYLINYGTDADSNLKPVFQAFRKEIVNVIMQK